MKRIAVWLCILCQLFAWSGCMADAPAYVQISSKKRVNLRAQGHADSPLVDTAMPGDVFVCMGQEKNGWYCVELEDGRIAYVSGKLAKPVKGGSEDAAAEKKAHVQAEKTQENLLDAEEILSLVEGAKEDITICLNQDISFSEEKALSNKHGVTVRILGNGHTGGVIRLAEGNYVFQDIEARQIVFEPDNTEICVTIEKDCVIDSNSAAMMLISEKPGVVRIDHAGTIIGVDAGVYFYSKAADLYLTNSGVIKADQALALGDMGSEHARIFDVCNTGELWGMRLAGADLVAGNEGTKISVHGGGMLFGSIGALVGGSGEIIIDQKIVAKSFGTLYQQAEHSAYYAKFEKKMTELHVASLMAEKYVLKIDEVNGQAIVDRGAKMRQYLMDGTVKPDTNPDDPKNFAWHSPRLIIRGTVEAQESVLGDLYLPRTAPLCFESALESTLAYARNMQMIYVSAEAPEENKAQKLYEDVQEMMRDIDLGGLKEYADVRVVHETDDVYSAGTGERMYAALGGKLTDAAFAPMPYWEIHPLDRSRNGEYFGQMLSALKSAPQGSRIAVDRDIDFSYPTWPYCSSGYSGLILDGQGHRIKHEQDMAFASSKSMVIENFAQLNRLQAYGGELTVRNCTLTGTLTLGVDREQSGTGETTVILDNVRYDGQRQANILADVQKGKLNLTIRENAQIAGEYPFFTAHRGAEIRIVNDGSMYVGSGIRLEPLGGAVSLKGTGSMDGDAGYASVYLKGDQGGKAVFDAEASEVVFDAEDGRKFHADISGRAERVKLCMDARSSAACQVRVDAQVHSLQLSIQDEAYQKEIHDGNVKQYIKQRMPKVDFSGAVFEKPYGRYLYVEIQYGKGRYEGTLPI